MTLIVAEIHDGGVSLVADTKITHANDDARTRHVFENALPKLAILRNDLCVGIAGNDPAGAMAELIARRNLSIDRIAEFAMGMRHVSVIIASLVQLPSLLVVGDGRADDRTTVGRAWVGDQAGYEVFQKKYHEWPPGTEPPFRLLSSLQWLLEFNPVPSIGGYHTRVLTTSKGFRFSPDVARVGPEELHVVVTAADALTLRLETPPAGDRTVVMRYCAVVEPTFGAIAYLIEPLGLALLFPHEEPFEPILFRANSMDQLLQEALQRHRQRLAA